MIRDGALEPDPLKKAGVDLIWFDSLGAKSMSIYLECGLIIDPGAAAMQPSYPLSKARKEALREEALKSIIDHLINASTAVVTHYHYDHVINLKVRPEYVNFFKGKVLYIKNPNKYINKSQWFRARDFIDSILKSEGEELRNYLIKLSNDEYPDPLNELPHALSKDFGDYSSRRSELLNKGRKWFKSLINGLWNSKEWVSEFSLKDGSLVRWVDELSFEVGNCRVRALKPWFHGTEYSRTGWVIPLVIESGGVKIFYTSDVMGPEIEDYADRIIDERPDAVILDGPSTYLFPYMLNRINLRRAVENAVRIVEESGAGLVIYDHHLLRDRRWRSRVAEVLNRAKEIGVDLLTAAEYLGRKPLIDYLVSNTYSGGVKP